MVEIPAGAQPQDLWRQVLTQMEAIGIPNATRIVICEWLHNGDPRPLIMAGDTNDLVLGLIIRMLGRDPTLGFHLELVPNRTGAPRKVGSRYRDLFMSAMYEARRRTGLNSDAAYFAVADDWNVGHETVRRAVKAVRKMGKAGAKPQ